VRVGILTLPVEPWLAMVDRWRRTEELGFDSVWTCDHFINPTRPDGPWFEGVTSLTALAAHTTTIRIGALVFCAAFHNPAFLARQLMTIDHVADGRLDIGLGAGTPTLDPSHAMTGIPDLAAGQRVERLRETLHIVDRLLRDRTLSHPGGEHQLQGARLEPGPVQQPRPPILVAANGPKALRVAAEFADTWNTYVAPSTDPAETIATIRERSARLDEHLAHLGRAPGDVRRSVLLMDRPDGGPLTSAAAFEDLAYQYAAAGVDELIVYWPAWPPTAEDRRNRVVERVATEVLPRLRIPR
jgi:alkanesulfonate monooxygenase SsuD/methylene tetrahydromethanopterin reductase-like flavin-dependent oxidoreductase (luciferase family)